MGGITKDLDDWLLYYDTESAHQGLCVAVEQLWKLLKMEKMYGRTNI
jgi:hypothetical protein